MLTVKTTLRILVGYHAFVVVSPSAKSHGVDYPISAQVISAKSKPAGQIGRMCWTCLALVARVQSAAKANDQGSTELVLN
jgi:hypothetical protein